MYQHVNNFFLRESRGYAAIYDPTINQARVLEYLRQHGRGFSVNYEPTPYGLDSEILVAAKHETIIDGQNSYLLKTGEKLFVFSR